MIGGLSDNTVNRPSADLFDIPSTWRVCSLEEVVKKEKGSIKIGPFGSQLKKTELTEKGLKVYGQENVLADNYSVGSRFISKEKFDSLKTFELLPGDFLITMMGTIGEVGIVPEGTEKGIIDSHLIRIRLNPQLIDSIYLKYLFQIPSITGQMKKSSRGVIMEGLNSGIVKALLLPLPPIAEQRRIVIRVEDLFKRLDSNGAELKKVKTQIVKYRLSTLEKCNKTNSLSTIRECIVELGQGWSPKCLNESTNDDEVWAVIKTSAIQKCRFVSTENKILPSNLSPRQQHEIKIGDVLITRAGPRDRCGVCCLVKKTKRRLINCDKVYRLRVNENRILPQFLEYVLNSPSILKEIEISKTGGNDSGLNLTQNRFLGLKIPLPSIDIQQQIVTEIESCLLMSDVVGKTVDDALIHTTNLRHSILKEAFCGRLVPQDAPGDHFQTR